MKELELIAVMAIGTALLRFLKGMDKTGIQVSPMTYFPMLETLRGVGGTEILAPYMDPED